MGQVRQSRWAPLVPWDGIQGKPAFLQGPSGDIQISDVNGLTAALNSKQNASGLARVAYTGRYGDLIGLPVLGSAAYSDVTNFITPAQLTAILSGYTTMPQSLARSFCRC